MESFWEVKRTIVKKYANYYYDKVKKKEFLIPPHAIENVRRTRFQVKTDAAAIQKNMHTTQHIDTIDLHRCNDNLVCCNYHFSWYIYILAGYPALFNFL